MGHPAPGSGFAPLTAPPSPCGIPPPPGDSMKNTKPITLALALALALAAGALLAACAQMGMGQGWQTLIDGGKGMDNFVSLGGANWRAEADAIVADRRPDALGTHYLTTK